jgi:hypothetical protein
MLVLFFCLYDFFKKKHTNVGFVEPIALATLLLENFDAVDQSIDRFWCLDDFDDFIAILT